MGIPEIVDLKFITFPTYYIAVLVLFLITLFVIWLQSVRDGFDKEKVFDIYFLSIAYLVGLYYLIDYFSFYNYYVEQNKGIILISTFFFTNLIVVKLLTLKWKWSIYRFLDIFSFSFFSLSLIIHFVQAYVVKDISLFIYIAVYSALYLLIFFSRNKLYSGVTLSIYLLLTVGISQFFFKEKTHLIFYGALVTISIVNLVIRSKSKMAKTKFNFDFIENIKQSLLAKDKRLKDEQQKLIEEDPYLQEGRDQGNAEAMDEAILEDRAKEELDIKKGNIEDMQGQVKKALGRIEEGEYGVCDKCGEDIDKARLEVYPEATKCLKCSK